MRALKVPLSWLQEYVEVAVPVEDLAHRLTLAGIEVAAVHRIGADWDPDRLVVAEVSEVVPHPNADRLLLARVEDGSGASITTITGAPNLRVADSGMKVPLARPGASLIDGHSDSGARFKVKRAKIRGVASEGVLCSEKELGLSDDHTGILFLEDEAPVGTPLSEWLGETVLELDLTPNLARCLSLVGVAREVAALTGGTLRLPPDDLVDKGPSAEQEVTLEIADPDLCPRYTAAVIHGVEVGESPRWMQRRLLSAGMRPINIVVDITNYVMLEWGQPLHAFDYDRLPREDDTEAPLRIVIRRARAGEKMTTLDGVERSFDPDTLLITTGETPVAVAGVMGGTDTEVDEATQNVLLEAANFEFINNRRTALKLRLPSEATSRFGRGVDPELTLPAARRAAELMRQLAGATVAKGLVDAYPLPPRELRLEITTSEVRRILGMDVPRSRVVEILTALEFDCETGPEDRISVTVPSHRLDVSIPADLIEEVARVIGYDQIPATLMRDALPPQRRNHQLEHEERIRDLLVGLGLSEVITHSLTRADSLAKLSPGGVPDQFHLRLANPISADHVVLRTTLESSLLENLSINLRHRPRGAIFELGRVYLPQADRQLPQEPRRLAIALAGPREESGWASGPPQAMDYYDLKGLIQAMLERLHLPDTSFLPTEDPSLLPGRAARMELDGKPLGALGEVHPQVREAFALPDVPVALAEMDLEVLFQLSQQEFSFHPIPRFPGVEEDLAVIADEAIPSGEIRDAILEAGRPLLEQASLFDTYRGEQIPSGKRGLAFSLVYRAPDRTLTEEEVHATRKRIEGRLKDGFGALPRD